MTTTAQPFPIEVARSNRERQSRASAARTAKLKAFCEDRETAIRIGNRARVIASKVAANNHDDGLFKTKVIAARKWIFWFCFICFSIVLISQADFWLGMPDVSEQMANKATSLITQLGGEFSAIAPDQGTPVSLRIACGAIVVLMWLTLTLGWKWCTETHSLRNSLAALAPDDDQGYQKIRQSIWGRRLLRVAYMCILAALLSYLYSFDLKKARDVVNVQQIEQTTASDADFSNFGIGISDGMIKTDQAIAPKTTEEQRSNLEQEARNLARPQVLVYCMLAMLHGMLLVIPIGAYPEDVRLAFFSPGKAESEARNLLEREATLLRELGSRIREAEPGVRDELMLEAMPIASKINEAFGGTEVVRQPSPSGAATSERPVTSPSSDLEDDSIAPFERHPSPRNETDDTIEDLFG